jgi:Glycosyl transferase family 2
MNTLTVIFPHSPISQFETTLNHFIDSSLVEQVWIAYDKEYVGSHLKCETMTSGSLTSGTTLNRLIEKIKTKYFLMIVQAQRIELGQNALERMISVAEQTQAGIVYADYYEISKDERDEHPVNEYQLGSIRDGFDFGPLLLFSTAAVKKALKKYGRIENVEYAGLYDLRLKVAIDHRLFHIQEFLSTKVSSDPSQNGEKQFYYVDPHNRQVQKEMEKVATKYLKYIGAYLEPKFEKVRKVDFPFPVEASVIIPVRNRLNMVADAVKSVLEQKADFPFNCIVIDNYSTDGTTYLLRELAKGHQQVKLLIPQRTDLGIGGCWNEAIFSEYCGRYAVQLDSDDMYNGPHILQKIVDEFHRRNYAMVIGSYKLVNMKLEELPSGIIDHREWTPTNGRNNALRINGLGAPRAFNTALLREAGGFPNVSYGEDYAIALRLSRQYQIGRIYEPLYLCRRWEGNSDSALPIEKVNQHDEYKDNVRTMEILARCHRIGKKK